jgi:hypothetical protein
MDFGKSKMSDPQSFISSPCVPVLNLGHKFCRKGHQAICGMGANLGYRKLGKRAGLDDKIEHGDNYPRTADQP